MTEARKSEILWAPWRMEYIRSEKETGCIFCDKPRAANDRENLIVHRGRWAFVIMNKYPYNNGHVMVVPYRHESELENLTAEENLELMELLQQCTCALKSVCRPHGFNLGMNVGAVAGAGIDDHLHFHLVPRWNADTNFMPIVGHTKVVSEGLWETCAQLQEALRSLQK